MNQRDNEARSKGVDSLINFETVSQNINTWQGPLDVQMLEVQKM